MDFFSAFNLFWFSHGVVKIKPPDNNFQLVSDNYIYSRHALEN